MLGLLAEAYLVQGHVPQADAVRHPYILSPTNLAQVSHRQRAILVRLLVADVLPEDALPAGTEQAIENGIASATRLLERIGTRQSLQDPTPAQVAQLVRAAFDALAAATDIGKALASTQTAARIDTVRIHWAAASSAVEAIVARDFGMALSRTTILMRDLGGLDVPPAVLTFSALATSLGEARDGEQVRRAFEAAASPAGGWQGKRYGEGGGSITAYPGLAFGAEWLLRRSDDSGWLSDGSPVAGLSLPIGIQWQPDRVGASLQGVDCRVIICGIGYFIPMADVGALLSYRLGGSDEVESEPNATLRQVFAPGAFLTFHLTRTVPATVIAGAHLMPSLRRVSGADTVTNRHAVRFGVGVVMDIVLFSF